MATNSTTAEDRLAELGIQLPEAPTPFGAYNGPITLHALLWRPPGRGPFPAILLNHGSGNENLICGR